MIVAQKGNTPDIFWSGVNIKSPDECWEWMGYKDKGGYGNISIRNYPTRTHRYAWELSYGFIPENMCVCHFCDNPPCCNPRHLWLGTINDNTQDMIKKGRKVSSKGESNGFSKLSEIQVLEIRRLYSMGKYSQTELAKMFEVTKSNIECIVHYKSWKWLVE